MWGGIQGAAAEMLLAKGAQAGRSRPYSKFETYSSLFDGVRAYLLVQRPGRDTEKPRPNLEHPSSKISAEG